MIRYFSPYPEEFSKCNKLFMCEFCLKYFRKSKTLERHKGKCEWRCVCVCVCACVCVHPQK